MATIHDIVSAMRAIAAGRIQAAQRALESARRYHDVIMRPLAILLAKSDLSPPAPSSPRVTLLVMASEQPLCGAFDPNVLALAERRWQELRAEGDLHLIVVGQRGARQLAVRGIAPDDSAPAATTLAGLRNLVKRLATFLGRHAATGELGTLRVIYGRYESISEQGPTEVQVLPLDLDRVRLATSQLPTRFHRYLPPPRLLAGLVDEYVFISLYLLAAESFASEQASRLVAMDASTRNAERILGDLSDLERRERQGEITQQIMELIGGRFSAGHPPS